MASLAELFEAFKNAKGRAAWSVGRDLDVMSGYDPALEEFVSGSSLGTGGHGLAAGLAGMIKASHGSPHMFDKFDFSKIGTGEGAQAFGRGGYFAQGFDSPVAKEYARVLSEKGGWDVSTIPNLDNNSDWANLSDRARAEITAAYHNQGDTGAKTKLKELAFWQKGEPDEKSLQNLLNNFDSLHKPLGHLYNVELKWPDAAREAADPLGEHHLLDWDAPLSEQPNIAEKLGFSTRTKDQIHDEYDDLVAKHGYYHQMPPEIQERVKQLQHELNNQVPNLTGEQFYSGNTENDYLHSRLSGKGFSKEQSNYLRDLGIPGIRYLDQGSRGTGTGTRNYVMFDDRFPEIVSRNGVSLSDLLKPDLSYQIEHKPMTIEGGAAPLHDLTQSFQEDIYGNPKQVEQIYGSGLAGERGIINLLQKLRGKPEELVDIYRGVPEGVTDINPGDWVTLHPRYAEEYGNVISKKVPAKYITSWPDSLVEFGYYPK